MNSWRVALLYNLQHPALVEPDAPPDALADLDTPSTIEAVEQALLTDGHEVFPLEADHTLLDTIRDVNPDICFNMARGTGGNGREAQIPALLEMLNIPYTGATGMGHALARDKVACKRIWQDLGLPTAPYQLMHSGDETRRPELSHFPLFVKPVHEGAGMGVSREAVVHDEAALRRRVEWLVATYHQPALVERYLPGREFSLAVLGNARTTHARRSTTSSQYVLPILEVQHASASQVHANHARAHGAVRGMNHERRNYACPAAVDAELGDELRALALAAFDAIGALDVARVDIRLDSDGRPFLLEIDVLPGLDPQRSRLVVMAEAHGLTYTQLITAIMRAALNRYALLHAPVLPQVHRRAAGSPKIGRRQSSPA